MKHSQTTESKRKKGKKVIEPIKVPRTKEGLAEVVKEVLARPAEVNGIWWQRHTFKDIVILLNSKSPKLTNSQREKLYTKLCIEMLEPLANKVIADRKFDGVQPWDLVSKMYQELSKYNLERGTSSYSYFYTVAIREAFSLSTLSSRQIVPVFLLPRIDYSLRAYKANPSIAEKDGFLTIQSVKTNNGKVRVWYQPVNGVLDIYSLYSMDFDEEDELSFTWDELPEEALDVSPLSSIIYTEDIVQPSLDGSAYRELSPLDYEDFYEQRLDVGPENYLNLVKVEIEKAAKNTNLAIKAYAFFVWLNQQSNNSKTEHQVWEAFSKEFKEVIPKAERPLIISVLKTAAQKVN